MCRSGAAEELKKRGIDCISYFQVDNPLVNIIDPYFLGFHIKSGSEMSSKMIPKAYALEKVGHFCELGGKMCVVEYSDLPKEYQERLDKNGQLEFRAGSVAIHILDRGFVERLGGSGEGAKLPFHRADKKIPCVDADGNQIKPEKPNGIKFEMFVFDAPADGEKPRDNRGRARRRIFARQERRRRGLSADLQKRPEKTGGALAESRRRKRPDRLRRSAGNRLGSVAALRLKRRGLRRQMEGA